MYESSGSDSEDEERLKRERLKQLQEQLQLSPLLHLLKATVTNISITKKNHREKERRRLAMLEQKMTYTRGLWNANTVLMGGLGKSPEHDKGSSTNLGEQVSNELEDILFIITHF